MKLVTFAVPCYNSAAYMEKCVETLLTAKDRAEIILIDDGSVDETPAICDRYAAAYPETVRAIHQPNGGHGEGVNQGLRHAEGMYYKVVDSDDWLDVEALQKMLDRLETLSRGPEPLDLMICNYVYEQPWTTRATPSDIITCFPWTGCSPGRTAATSGPASIC